MQRGDDSFDGEYSTIVPFRSGCFDGLFEAAPQELRIFFEVIAAVGWRPLEFLNVPVVHRERVMPETYTDSFDGVIHSSWNSTWHDGICGSQCSSPPRVGAGG